MADLAASTVAVNDIESAQNAPVSEATVQKVGGAINGLLTRMTTAEANIASGNRPLNQAVSLGASVGPTAAGSYTFTGRPCLIVIYSGSQTSGPWGAGNILTLSTSAATLLTTTLAASSSIDFALNPKIAYLASHTAGTYSISLSKNINQGAASFTFLVIEL